MTKKNLLMTIIAIFGFATITSAQTVGYILGDQGAVYKTTNAGANWTNIATGFTFGSNTLNGVHFVDASTGYIVGDQGAVYKTTNAGANWTNIATGFTFGSNTLNGVHFVDASTGYIVGDQGAVYKTTNAGANWTNIATGFTFGSNTLNGVHFVDASTGYILGDQGALYKTTNSGANWTNIATGFTFGSNTLNDIYFVIEFNSVSEFSEDNLFTVFPNPAQSAINIKADNKLIGEVYSIYDNTGRVALTGKLNSKDTTIELNNLSGGIYMFSVGENMKQTFKVIKE